MRHEPRLNHTNVAKEVLQDRQGDETVDGLVRKLVEDFGVAHVMYFAVHVPGGSVSKPISIGNYPKEWTDIYQKKNYINLDPVGKRLHEGPVVWSTMTGLTEAEAAFMAESVSHIGPHGVTIPLWSPGSLVGISLTSRESGQSFRDRLPRLIWAGTTVGQRIHDLTKPAHKVPGRLAELSEQEKTYLNFVAAGMDPEKIAAMCKLSLKKVQRHIDSAQRKLKAKNLPHTVTRAFLGGQISL